jgi:hypothetical protein
MAPPFVKRLLLCWFLVAGVAIAAPARAWLLLSPDAEDSVMSLAVNEKDALLKAGWTVEAAGAVQPELIPQSALLHRMIRTGPNGIERMLESDAAKVEAWKKAGFVEEGQLGYVSAAKVDDGIAVIQFMRGEKRLWLAREPSAKTAEAKGWKRQGPQFWLWPAPKPDSAN